VSGWVVSVESGGETKPQWAIVVDRDTPGGQPSAVRTQRHIGLAGSLERTDHIACDALAGFGGRSLG
jgi:hypothetical protein